MSKPTVFNPTPEETLRAIRESLAAELVPGRDDEAIAAWGRMVPGSTDLVIKEADRQADAA